MSKWIAAFSVVVFAATSIGCGGPDNVAACKSFVAKVKCGSVDISSSVPCDSYKNTSCDITAYFACLETAYVCVNGSYDATKLANVANCASKATCK